MTKIYLTGHRAFGNQGCEAAVRSTVKLLSEELGRLFILVPSSNIARNARQWPEATD